MTRPRKYDHLLSELCERYYDRNESYMKIGRDLNMSPTTVKAYLERGSTLVPPKRNDLYDESDIKRTVTPPSLIVNDLKVMAIILIALFGVIMLFRWVF